MDGLKSGKKETKSEAGITLASRSESQERIFKGITVTKDVEVAHD